MNDWIELVFNGDYGAAQSGPQTALFILLLSFVIGHFIGWGLKVRTKSCVILELKFTDRFARWMHDMVRTFNLERCSVPKYVRGIDAVGLGGSYRGGIETRTA